MGPFAPIVAIIGAGIGKLLSVGVAKLVIQKAILYGLMTTVLPVILYKLFQKIYGGIFDYLTSYMQGAGFSSATVQITGMAGWIGNQINLSAALSIIMSAVALRWTLNILKVG